MVERAAQALFEFVFAVTKRLDGKHLWLNSDEDTKAGFRREAIAVLQAAWPSRSLDVRKSSDARVAGVRELHKPTPQ
jgi:hypothetical protein